MNIVEVKPGTLMKGRYRVLSEIQRGGTAVVLRGQDEQGAKEMVALKCMTFNTKESVPLRVIQAEINFSTSVKSPSFVKLVDVFNHGSHMLVIAMELVEGPDLLDLLNSKGGSIPESEALFYVFQLASAALVMHENGFAHRDIKPENSVITPSHQLKMIDFGLAKHLTSARTLGVGTPDYMAPEVIPRSNDQVSSSYDATLVDAWALGVTLFLLCTGRYPFEDPKQPAAAVSVLNILRGNIQPFPSTMSEGTQCLIRSLLKTNPNQRMKLSSFKSDPFVIAKALEYARVVQREDLILNDLGFGADYSPTLSINITEIAPNQGGGSGGISGDPRQQVKTPPRASAPSFLSRLFGGKNI